MHEERSNDQTLLKPKRIGICLLIIAACIPLGYWYDQYFPDEPLKQPIAQAKTGSEATGEPSVPEGWVLNGKVLSLPKPVYPADLERRGISGQVQAEINVDEKGNVAYVAINSGPEELRQTVAAAALHAKFSPTLVGGRPVKVRATVTYTFTSSHE